MEILKYLVQMKKKSHLTIRIIRFGRKTIDLVLIANSNC